MQDSSLQIFLPISHLNNKTEKICERYLVSMLLKTEKLELEKKANNELIDTKQLPITIPSTD